MYGKEKSISSFFLLLRQRNSMTSMDGAVHPIGPMGFFWFEIDEIGSQRKIRETKGFGSISWLKKIKIKERERERKQTNSWTNRRRETPAESTPIREPGQSILNEMWGPRSSLFCLNYIRGTILVLFKWNHWMADWLVILSSLLISIVFFPAAVR